MKKNVEISPLGSLLIYKKGYKKKFIESIIRKKKLNGLRIFVQLKEDYLENLYFLKDYSFLKKLDITSVEDYDFSFLSSLIELKELTITAEGNQEIDLNELINLEKLTIQWRKNKVIGLENCQKINTLILIDYNEKNFLPISKLNNLKSLSVKTSTIESLNGIENFHDLNYLLLGNCKKLSSISQIENLKKINSLDFDYCGKIYDFDLIGKINNLRELKINDCKSMKSIKFIENMKNLENLELLGNTLIKDGDLIPAKRIKQVFYKHRKHYNIIIDE